MGNVKIGVVTLPGVVSRNVSDAPATRFAGSVGVIVKLAAGAGARSPMFRTSDFVAVWPLRLSTVSVTVTGPALAYTWVGLRSVEPLPSPKSHRHVVCAVVLREASVNVTVSPMRGAAGLAVKSATGGSTGPDTKTGWVTVSGATPGLDTVSRALYVPARA